MIANLHGFIDNLIDRVVEVETRKFHETINELINSNKILLNRPANGFNYLGVDYGADAINSKWARGSPALMPSLVPKMAYQVKLKQSIDTDRQTMYVGLTHLLRPCATEQDLRDALPECLVELTNNQLQRTRPEAYTIQEVPYSLTKYQRALDQINKYFALRMLH